MIEVDIDGKEMFVDTEQGNIVLAEDLRKKGDPDDIAEVTEALALQQLSPIPIQAALKSAESFASGQVHSANLENEAGNLVYTIVIGAQEVLVDAGNGQVLSTTTVGQTSENRSHPKGSIQVPLAKSLR